MPNQSYRVFNNSTQALIITTFDLHGEPHYRLLPGCASPQDEAPRRIKVKPTEADRDADSWDVWDLKPGFDVHVTESDPASPSSMLQMLWLVVQLRGETTIVFEIKSVWASRKEYTWVTVLGAGITGLTAAHELVTRCFRVQVIEKAHGSPVDETGGSGVGRFWRGLTSPDVGGIARTQWTTQPLLRGDTPLMSQALPPHKLAAMRSVHGDCHWFGAGRIKAQESDDYWAFGVPWLNG